MQFDDATWAAWLAGVIDGEGCINVYPTNNGTNYAARITIANTDVRLLEKAQRLIGHGTISMSRKPTVQDKHAYTLFVEKASVIRAVLVFIRPWLIIKGEHADIVLRFTETVSNKRTPPDVLALRKELMGQIKKLTRKGRSTKL